MLHTLDFSLFLFYTSLSFPFDWATCLIKVVVHSRDLRNFLQHKAEYFIETKHKTQNTPHTHAQSTPYSFRSSCQQEAHRAWWGQRHSYRAWSPSTCIASLVARHPF
eukprot:m.48786 g.48786  ORF g.48786 m.48786 type:complete len:107 (+) comp17839_c0_seq1:542-862(+)